MTIEFACCVDIGVKATNDDRVMFLGGVLEDGAYMGESPAPALAALCDGCGGYAGGFLAAQTVLEGLGAVPAQDLLEKENLERVLEQCREDVYRKKRIYPDYEEMCTTVAGCVFGEDRTVIFHAGDSRVYRIDRYGMARMTVDHSAVQNMIDMGRITEAEAKVHPSRNIITRCIGVACPPPEIYVSRAPMEPGETYLMCSDGLWEYVPEEEIREMVTSGLPLHRIAGDLVARALDLGSDDNVSVLLCSRPGSAPVSAAEEPFVLD